MFRKLSAERGQNSVRVLMSAAAAALAWVLHTVADVPHGSLAGVMDWCCILLAGIATVWPPAWLAVGAIYLASQILPYPTSLATYFLTLAGAADLNARMPIRNGLLMIVLGLAGVGFTLRGQPVLASTAMALFLLTPAITAMLLRSRVERYQLRLELLSAQRAQEQLDLARDMHDTVALSMSHIVLRTAQELHRTPLSAREQRVLNEIQEEARTALQELRSVLNLLRSDTDNPQHLDLNPVAKEWERCRSVLTSAGFNLAQDNGCPPELFDEHPEIARVLSYAIRELTANAIRHGDSSQDANFVLTSTPEHVNLLASNTVLTDERSAPLIPASGHGLQGLTERLAEVSGTLQVMAEDDKWLTIIRIPIDPTPDSELP